VVGTRGIVDLEIGGGYKFGGRLVLNLESDDLGSLPQNTDVQFKLATVTARELFTAPLDFSFFVGQLNSFGTSKPFQNYFGAKPFGTRFQGYLYFPEGVRYEGLHSPAGTGLSLATSSSLSEIFRTEAYIYQDSYLGKGNFSSDLRMLLNLEQFKLETFVGASFPQSKYGIYRGGLLMFFNTGNDVGEFFTQIGIPRYDPNKDPFTIDLFYFLFEPRLRIDFFSIIPTLFWHPEFYNHTLTGELGTTDININFMFGRPMENPLSGGLENRLVISTKQKEQLQVILSPYLSAITSGIIWKFKVNTRVYPFDINDFFEAFVGVQAEF
jgi:hypothetical protein